MERVPIELWEQILLKVMEMDETPIFATSCTPYTFLYFVNQQTSNPWHRKPHYDYLERRRGLRLVCRTWNEFVLSTSHRWLQLGQGNAMYELDSTTTSPGCRGGVGPVEKLSTTINWAVSVIPVLSWVSHILKRPENHSPLRAYTLQLFNTPVPGYNPFDDLLVGANTIQGTNANTNTTLHSLSITTSIDSDAPIAFSQISRTFTGLRSLFLTDVTVAPQQALALPHLEVLYLNYPLPWLETLQGSMETWKTPALRHVYLGHISVPLMDVLDRFLGQYVRQIESLVLSPITTYPPHLLNLPSGFWAQFTELRLLGLDNGTLEDEEWSGWSVVPPPTHPCRYLVCRINTSMDRVVNKIESIWTWHDGVRLVAGHADWDKYYVVTKYPGSSITSMESNYGVLPEF